MDKSTKNELLQFYDYLLKLQYENKPLMRFEEVCQSDEWTGKRAVATALDGVFDEFVTWFEEVTEAYRSWEGATFDLGHVGDIRYE